MVKNAPANAGDTGTIPGVWEDITCSRTTKHVCHNYRACAPEPGATATETHMPRACALQQEKPPGEAHAPRGRGASAHHN